MSMAEGIREVVADVGVQTADINTAAVTTSLLGNSAVTTAKLGDLAVSTAKLGNSAVTTDKLAIEAGKWFTGTFSIAATSTAFTLTMTSACTIIKAIVQFTAACTGGRSFDLEDSGALTILAGRIVSTLATHVGPQESAVSGERTLSLAAGAELRGIYNAAVATAGGTYYINYIATP